MGSQVDDPSRVKTFGLSRGETAEGLTETRSASAFPWEAAEITPAAQHAAFLANGAHFGRHEEQDDDTRRIEPQSVVVTTALVGILLAAMGYFLDFH